MTKVLIDSDTGLDDAMAFVHGMLEDSLEIVGVTTVHGNASVEDCTAHALEIIELMGKDIPVVQGASHALVSGCGPAPQVHGAHGRGPLGRAESSRSAEAGYGAVFILEQVKRYGGDLTVVAMGRLTNIALAYRLDPQTMSQVGKILWMGGAFSVSGNTSPVAEANLDGDPEAAKIVCLSGLPLTILPLDVTMHTRITDADVAAMETVDHPGVQHLAKILPYYLDFYESILGVRECAGHCGLLLALALDPSLIVEEHTLPVDVETGGILTRGMLVVDRRDLRAVQEARGLSAAKGVNVIFQADNERYHDLFMKRILSAEAPR